MDYGVRTSHLTAHHESPRACEHILQTLHIEERVQQQQCQQRAQWL